MTVVLQIAENILLLSFMGLAFLFLENNRSYVRQATANILFGLCFGLTAALVTVVPVTLGDGATVDARAGPVILSGIVGGPIAAAIAGVMGAAARGFVGGSFTFSGVAVYLVYAVMGLALRHFRVVLVEKLPSLRATLITVFASLCGAASMFVLIQPFERALRWLVDDLPLIFVANTLSVAYSIACISLVLIFVRKSAEVDRVNDALSLAKRAGRFGIWDYDIASGKLVWDDVSRELHGVEPSAFNGRFEDWERSVHPDDLDQAKKRFFASLAEGSDGIFDAEYRVRLPDGRLNWIKGDAIVIRDQNGKPVRVAGSNIDLTAIRRTENQLAEAKSVAIQAQKIETVGQLTGGIAHDFNNLLAVVMGNLELLLMKMQGEGFSREEATRYIEDSLMAAKRGAELTQNMLAYARKAQLLPVALDINEVVRQTEQWISRTIESSIRLSMKLKDDIWLTMADMGSMQSALVNLLVNARDAVAGSGRISITTANVEIDREFTGHDGERVEPGRYVMLAVGDDGIGMDTDAMDRMFDPFYSTKPVGQGTGLGLSTVQGFVKQSRGAIKVESAPGDGTLIRLYFPALDDADQTSVHDLSGDAPGSWKQKTSALILLVEDQDDVRTVIRRMLESGGHKVQTAKSGDEAFDLLKLNGRFDLVVTDIVMPGELQGPSLARAVREQHPHMRFLYITGYDSRPNTHEEDVDEDAIRLMKPVTQGQLLNAVSATLNGST